jgi:hypothetical protein
MADSSFWRDLATQFSALQDKWRLRTGGASDLMCIEVETLAKRGASEIANAGAPDLLGIWLAELRKAGLPTQVSGQSDEVLSEGEFAESISRGFIDGLCEASATFCKRLEAQAVQAEFEEKQRNDPRNWTQFRQQYEAFKNVRELRSEPPEQIPEEFVRQTIARISGTKPQDVTREQIAFEVAGLLTSTRRHIEVIPSTIKPGSPPEPDAHPGYVGIDKNRRDNAPESVPQVKNETIAAQIQRLREECAPRKDESSDKTEALGSVQARESEGPRASPQERTGIERKPKVRPGRPPRLASDFVDFAGELWLTNQHRNSRSRSNAKAQLKATDGELGAMAALLDGKDYVPPAKYLERKAADDLKSYNSRNSNSKTGVIKTWSQLVSVADKDHLRGMRRLLSRCAKKVNFQLLDRVRK